MDRGRNFQRIFADPLPSGDYILVLIDEFSRYPEAEILQSTSARTTIPKLDKILSTHGIPVEVKIDSGPPFNSQEFKEFAEDLGFSHRKITPLWPKANAEAERFMKTLNKAIITAHTKQLNWKQLYRFLRNYRATPHATTDKTPAELLFGRKMRTKLPEVAPTVSDPALRCQDATAKNKMKGYADDRNNAKPATFRIGDDVLVRQRKRNKFSPYNNPHPYHIVAINGSMITAENARHKITRNSSFFKRITRPPNCESTMSDDHEDEYIPKNDVEEPVIQEQPPRRYPFRSNRGQPPNRFSVP